jgi:disulfide bond formation protein DsbB
MDQSGQAHNARTKIEDFDLLDLIRFFWAQKAYILAGSIIGAMIGLYFSIRKMNLEPPREVSFTFESPASDPLTKTIPTAEMFVEFINSTGGSNALYEGVLKSAKGRADTALSDVSAAKFRTFLFHVERIDPNALHFRFRLPSVVYFDGFDAALANAMNYVVEKYNTSISDPSIQFYRDYFDLEMSINATLLTAIKVWDASAASSADKKAMGAMKLNETFQSKLDFINLIALMLPDSNASKANLQSKGRELYNKWRLTEERVDKLKRQPKDPIAVPWAPVVLKESSLTNVQAEISPVSVALPSILTGIFLGLVFGLLLGAIRSFVQKNRSQLKQIFSTRTSHSSIT